MCVCNLSYPAYRAHAPHYVAIVVCMYHIFSTLSHKRHDFRKKNVIDIKCEFWFSLQLLSETFLIIRRIHWDTLINVRSCRVNYPLFLSDFNETWIFSIYFRKILKYKSHENPSNGSRVVPCGSTDTTKVIVSFRSFSKAPKTHQMELKNNKKFWLLLTNLHSTNIRVNKSRIMTWPGHVARTGRGDVHIG